MCVCVWFVLYVDWRMDSRGFRISESV